MNYKDRAWKIDRKFRDPDFITDLEEALEEAWLDELDFGNKDVAEHFRDCREEGTEPDLEWCLERLREEAHEDLMEQYL